MTSRCARELFLLDEPPPEFGEDDRSLAEWSDQRKRLLLDRLQRLEALFSIVVIGYSVMGNHLHLILRSIPEEGRSWSAAEVVDRWLDLHPPRNRRGPIDLSPADLQAMVEDTDFVAVTRRKLMDLSQFMKELKQHVAVEANKQEGCGGAFWGGRFKSKLIDDHERGQLVRTMIYVDLNPFAAGLCTHPETGRFTSLASRLGRNAASTEDPSATSSDAFHRRRASWLVPMEGDGQPAAGASGLRRVVLPGLTLARYLALLDTVARLLRDGKTSLARSATDIFERLGLEADDLLTGFPRFARGSPHM